MSFSALQNHLLAWAGRQRCRVALQERLTLPGLLPLAGCLVACACLMQWLGWLPPAAGLPVWCAVGGVLYLSRRARPLVLCLLLMAGLTVSVQDALQGRLPASRTGQLLTLHATVLSLPQRDDFNDRVRVRVEQCKPDCGMLRQVLLSWSAAPGGSQDETAQGLNAGIQRAHRGDGYRADRPAGPGREMTGPLRRDEDAAWPVPGQRWRLQVKLKPPVAAVNPGAFDAEQRLLQQGIDAVGRVVARQRLPDAGAGAFMVAVEGWRTRLRGHLEQLLVQIGEGGAPNAHRWSLLGVVTGLSLGDQAAIGAAQWGLFSRTGVSHLMAISGMHVTLLAMLVVALCNGGYRALARHGPARWQVRLACWPRPWLVLVPGLLAAFGYAALSGWGVPAQRTCFMLLAAAVLRLGGRCHGAVPPVLLAAACIVALDPWAVAQAGFWLSFCAVLALIWCAQQPLPEYRLSGGGLAGWRRNLHEAIRSQWAATILLTPLTIAFFSTWSLVGPLANALAIPWVGFVLTPMAIAVMLLAPWWPWLAGGMLKALLWQLELLLTVLRWLDGLPLASLSLPQPGAASLVAALLGAVLLLAPAALRRPRLGLLCLMPMLLAPARPAPADALVVTALDIGQGSMVLLEQGGHRLLYDAGPARAGGRSRIEGVLLPWLQGRGLDGGVDWLVLSHLDAGHAGGAGAAIRHLRPARLMAPFAPELAGIRGAWATEVPPEARTDDVPLPSGRMLSGGHPDEVGPVRLSAGNGAQGGGARVERGHQQGLRPGGAAGARRGGAGRFVPCLAGLRLPWGQGVIEVLHPTGVVRSRQQARDDRHSCVLRIRTPAGSVLLAGDLPVEAERPLLQRTGTSAWQADVLLLPRGGSRHGAGDALLAAVQPRWGLIQIGHGQPHGHPHPQLRERLRQQGVQLLRTDLHGAVRIELRHGQPATIHRSRLDDAPYWRVPLPDPDEGGR